MFGRFFRQIKEGYKEAKFTDSVKTLGPQIIANGATRFFTHCPELRDDPDVQGLVAGVRDNLVMELERGHPNVIEMVGHGEEAVAFHICQVYLHATGQV